MKQFPKSLQQKLKQREQNSALRRLLVSNDSLIDFSSNDYIGFANNEDLFHKTHQYLIENKIKIIDEELIFLESEFQTKGKQFTGVAYVTFQSERGISFEFIM